MVLTKVYGNTIISSLCVASFQVTPVNIAVIDSLKLVHDRQRLAGAMPVAGFVRLVESLQDACGNLDYVIRGDVDRHGKSLLRLRVTGAIPLQCQRCLDAFEHRIDIDTALRLVAPDALDGEHSDDPDEPDCIAASTELDLAALIEDEVLLALPAYPRHEEGRCSTTAGRVGIVNEAGVAGEPGAKIPAFSALQALKAKLNR
jgi:uncharacterized protein